MYGIEDVKFTDDYRYVTFEMEGGRVVEMPTTEFTGGIEPDTDGTFTVFYHGEPFRRQDGEIDYHPDHAQVIDLEEHIDGMGGTDDLTEKILQYDGELSKIAWAVKGRKAEWEKTERTYKVFAATKKDLFFLTRNWATTTLEVQQLTMDGGTKKHKMENHISQILQILEDETIAPNDRISDACVKGALPENLQRLCVVASIRRTKTHTGTIIDLMGDTRSVNALVVAERHALGEASDEELEDACDDALESFWDATWNEARMAAHIACAKFSGYSYYAVCAAVRASNNQRTALNTLPKIWAETIRKNANRYTAFR